MELIDPIDSITLIESIILIDPITLIDSVGWQYLKINKLSNTIFNREDKSNKIEIMNRLYNIIDIDPK